MYIHDLHLWNSRTEFNLLKLGSSDLRGRDNSQLLSEINASLGRGLVNILATCSLEGTYSNLTFCSSTCSCRKWYLIGMCLVLECITGFFDILMAFVLSEKMEIGGENLIWMSCKFCIIQSSHVQHDAVATYYAYVVDKAIELCFLLNRHTNRGPI